MASFEGYFAVSFASVGNNMKLDFRDCSTMNLNQAMQYSRYLIEKTIYEMKQENDKGVDFPIDTLVIPLSDSKTWIRNLKPTGEEAPFRVEPNDLHV